MTDIKTLIIEKTTICDCFEIINSENNEQGVVTIGFNHAKTGEKTYLRLMPYMENIALESDSIKGAYFISLMADEGFHISIQPGELRNFLHILLHPEESVTSFGKPVRTSVDISLLSSEAKLISSYLNVNKDVDDE